MTQETVCVCAREKLICSGLCSVHSHRFDFINHLLCVVEKCRLPSFYTVHELLPCWIDSTFSYEPNRLCLSVLQWKIRNFLSKLLTFPHTLEWQTQKSTMHIDAGFSYRFSNRLFRRQIMIICWSFSKCWSQTNRQ